MICFSYVPAIHAHVCNYLCFYIRTVGIFGLEDFAITRTSDITQSTCQVNFETINNQPSINIQLLTTPTNTITMNTAVSSTTDSAPIATNMITMNTTFSSATDSAPIAIAVASVVGGILGLCIIFICIVGLIIKNKKRQGSIKRGIFTIESLTSLFNRYVCCNYIYVIVRMLYVHMYTLH